MHAMRRAPWLWLLTISACTGGQTGVPTHADGDGDDDGSLCMFDPDAATPLGLSGRDLLTLYGGSHSFVASGSRVQGAAVSALPDASFQLDVRASEEQLEVVNECDIVAITVGVRVRNAEQMLDREVTGLLRATSTGAELAFGSEERFNGVRVLRGVLTFEGAATKLYLSTAPDTNWLSPPVRSP
jgi:hypothetical protein